MKSALGVLFVSLISAGAAADNINFVCSTEPLTTSIAATTDGSTVTMRVVNHNGTDYLPLNSGGITPSDLAGLAEKAKGLAQLGTIYDISMSAANCQSTAQGLVDCHGSVDAAVNGHKVSYLAVALSQSTTQSLLFAKPLAQTIINVLVTVDDQDYDFAMTYMSSGCVTADTSLTAN